MDCPKCGKKDLWRDEADVGIGTMYGPYGCGDCGWSEDPAYDLSDPVRPPFDDVPGNVIDQWGGIYRKFHK